METCHPVFVVALQSFHVLKVKLQKYVKFDDHDHASSLKVLCSTKTFLYMTFGWFRRTPDHSVNSSGILPSKET